MPIYKKLTFKHHPYTCHPYVKVFNCHPTPVPPTDPTDPPVNTLPRVRHHHHHHHNQGTPDVTWTVPALCAAYNWPTGLPGKGVIGIVELGGGWVKSDIDAYFKSIGQPSPSITDVSVDGTTNTPGNDADVEVALDIEVAAAAYYVATGRIAAVRVYWSQDIASAVAKAAKDGCDVCSISWGADEAEWGKKPASRWTRPLLLLQEAE